MPQRWVSGAWTSQWTRQPETERIHSSRTPPHGRTAAVNRTPPFNTVALSDSILLSSLTKLITSFFIEFINFSFFLFRNFQFGFISCFLLTSFDLFIESALFGLIDFSHSLNNNNNSRFIV